MSFYWFWKAQVLLDCSRHCILPATEIVAGLDKNRNRYLVPCSTKSTFALKFVLKLREIEQQPSGQAIGFDTETGAGGERTGRVRFKGTDIICPVQEPGLSHFRHTRGVGFSNWHRGTT